MAELHILAFSYFFNEVSECSQIKVIKNDTLPGIEHKSFGWLSATLTIAL